MSGSNYSNSTDSTEELQFGLITQSTQVSSGLTSLGSSLADLLPFENDISSLFANGNAQSGLFQLGIDLPSSVNGTVASGGSAINFGQLNFGVSLPGTTFSNAVDAAIPINPGDLQLGITLPSASASVVLPEVPSLYSAIGNLSSGLASLESPSSSPQKIYVVYGGYGGGGYSGGGSGGTYTFTIPTNNSSGGSQSSYNSTSISSLINQVSSELNLVQKQFEDSSGSPTTSPSASQSNSLSDFLSAFLENLNDTSPGAVSGDLQAFVDGIIAGLANQSDTDEEEETLGKQMAMLDLPLTIGINLASIYSGKETTSEAVGSILASTIGGYLGGIVGAALLGPPGMLLGTSLGEIVFGALGSTLADQFWGSSLETSLENAFSDAESDFNTVTQDIANSALANTLEGALSSLTNDVSSFENLAGSAINQFTNDLGSSGLSALAQAIEKSFGDLFSGLFGGGSGNKGGSGSGNGSGAGSGPFGTGGLLGAIEGLFGAGEKRSDPLVIELTGNSFNLVTLSANSPHFDFSGDGFATQTGWIASGAGFLVLQDANGSVEMLGSGSVGGIAALEAAVGASSGEITSSNSVFSRLMVWEDTNGNGIIDPGELHSLQALGIASISLNATSSGEVINGNTVEATLTYTMADGQTGAIGEVEFDTDPAASTPDVPISVPSVFDSLPQLNGSGTMYDLHSAMALNTALLISVIEFVSLPTNSSTATIESSVQAILYEWAGVTNVNPSSRGAYTNAQQLEFLEAYLGESYDQPSHGNNDPSPFGGPDVSMAWNDAFNGLMARLILQSPLASEVPEFEYDASLNAVLPVISFPGAIASMEERLGTPNEGNFSAWQLQLQVLDASAIDLNLMPGQIYNLLAEGTVSATTQTVAALAAAVAAGQTISFAGNGSFVISGSTLNDVIYAGPGISKLIGNGGVAAGDNGSVYIGPNTDTTNGDIFVYNLGDGRVEIDEAPSVGPDNYPSQATLSLGAGITAGQVTLTRDASGDDILTIDSNGDVIQIDNQNLSGTPNYHGVSDVTFADGTVWTAQQLNTMGDIGSPTYKLLYGSQGADTFNSEGYATYAQGYGGGDTFIYNVGYGAFEINENNSGQLVDNILTFGSGITPSEVKITAGASGSVILTIGTAGDKITLDNMLSGPQYGIDSVEFANGTIWSAQNILAGLSLASGVSLSSYFNIEQIGQQQTSTGLPNLLYVGSANPADILFEADAAGDLTVSTDGYVGDDIVLPGDLYGNVQSRVASLLFADGSTLSLNGGLSFTEVGTSTNTTLTGSDWGSNLFELAPGGDSVTLGNGQYGSSRQNTIDYNIGDGAATINLNGQAGTIQFGKGITASDLSFQASDAAGDVKITVLGANGSPTGDSIVIQKGLYDNSWHSVISNFTLLLADGTSVPINGNLTDTLTASATNTTLVGSGWEANLFELAPGGDSVTLGNSQYGGSSQNTIDYNTGDGAATINLNGATGTIQFGAGITASDLSFQALDAAGDVTITVLGANGSPTGDSIVVQKGLYDNSWHSVISNFTLLLADGTSVPINGNLTDTWTASVTNTTLVGSGWAANLFELAPGGDSVTLGNGQYGGSSQNTIDYNTGDGAATINLNGGIGTIQLGAGITASELSFQAPDAAGDVTITVHGVNGSATGDSIVIQKGLYDNSWHSVISNFTVLLADGTSVPINGSLTDTWTASATNTTLVGSGWAANLFELAPGGDSVTLGNGQYGGSSQNTIDYNTGDGAATINLNGGIGTIQLGAGITASELSFQAPDAAGDVTITVLGANGSPTGDSIVIQKGLYDNSWHSVISNFTVLLADGTSVPINGSLTDTWTASATNTTLVGSGWAANLFELAPGSDSVTLGNGQYGGSSQNTIDYNTGDGAATVNPNGIARNSGTIVMGAGITSSNVIFESNNANGNLTINLLNASGTMTGDSITILGDFQSYNAANSEIGAVTFANGSTIAFNGTLVNTWIGSSTNTTLVGSDYDPNLFELAPGGDSVTLGNGQYGGSSQNTIDYNTGDGAATINLNGATGTIQFGAGITASDLSFQASDAAGDVKITVLGANGSPTGDSIVIQKGLYANSWHSVISNFTVLLADGTSVPINGNLTDTWTASATNTTLVGSGWAANLFELAPGGDSVTLGNGQYGGSSQNTIDYNTGDGAATINLNGGIGTIQLGAGITASELSFQAPDAAGDVTITVHGVNGSATGDSIVIQKGLYDNSWHSVISNFTVLLADGTSVPINGSLTDTWTASATNTTLVGSGWAANLFELAPGGDSVTLGNGQYGGSSQNTIDYDAGDGAATISLNGGNGNIQFQGSITEKNLWFVQSGSNLVIDVLGSSDHLTVNGFFNSPSSISEIKVSDGLEIDSKLSNLLAVMTAYSANNPGFDPVTAPQMPTNPAIQSEIAAAWHS